MSGVVIGWMTRLVVVLAVLGVLAVDGFNVGVSRVNGTDDANAAASAAAADYKMHQDLAAAYSAAAGTLHSDEVLQPKTFRVDSDGTVHVTVVRTVAHLLAFPHIPGLKSLRRAVLSGAASPPSV